MTEVKEAGVMDGESGNSTEEEEMTGIEREESETETGMRLTE